ncbi:MAG: 50S ribosomal protein L23 [Patescibacteria group bacterium]
MDLTNVILGEVVTEKAERLKIRKVATLRVHPHATKIDVRNALRQYFGVDPKEVRITKVRSKHRLIGRGRRIEKRANEKRALVTLGIKSKPLDLTKFQT